MNDLLTSTGCIVAAYAWYLMARRVNWMPYGPQWLRGLIGTGLVGFACYAAGTYANDVVLTDLCSACLSFLILSLHLIIAILMAFMLWTMEETIRIRLSVERTSNKRRL